MDRTTDWWLLIPRPVRELPADLTAVVVLTLATILAVVTPGLNDTPLRVVVGLPFVLFLPGYALIAALFPEAGDPPTDQNQPAASETAEKTAAETGDGDDGLLTTADRNGIDGIERVALSFGLSIAVVPLIGLVLNFTPFGIRLLPILVAVSGFTLVMTAVAAHRRWQLPVEDQFRVPYRQWLATTRDEFTNPDSRLDGALNVLLVASLVLAVSSVAYAVAVPQQGEAFTEYYLLTEADNGTLVADDYPTEYTAGDSRPIIVGVGNHEHKDVTYTTVVKMQKVSIQNNDTMVREESELQRFQTIVAAGETVHRNVSITPEMTGTRLRLAFLLYQGDPPATPTVDNAYRETHLWVNVSTPAQSAATDPVLSSRP